jgi:hypothetical protein
MWPRGPMFTNSQRQRREQSTAIASEPYGSFLPATTMPGQATCPSISSKPCAASRGKAGPAGSGGATRSTPARPCVRATAAAARQPRLCATSAGGSDARVTAATRVAIHAFACGCSQSCRSTRRQFASSASQRDCQWDGPELPIPGTIRIGGVASARREWLLIQRGRVDEPIRYSSTARAHWRPSRIAHTTSDWPRRMSPAANTLSTLVL